MIVILCILQVGGFGEDGNGDGPEVVEKVKKLLDDGMDKYIDHPGDDDITPAAMAAYDDKPNLLTLLVQKGTVHFIDKLYFQVYRKYTLPSPKAFWSDDSETLSRLLMIDYSIFTQIGHLIFLK